MVEHQFVVLVVAGSNPVVHPIVKNIFIYFIYARTRLFLESEPRSRRTGEAGLS